MCHWRHITGCRQYQPILKGVNSNSSETPFVIGHNVMRDSMDSAAVTAALNSVGRGLAKISDPTARSRLANIFCQGGGISRRNRTRTSSHDAGQLRHWRHSTCPPGCRRADWRPGRDRCCLCFGDRGASGAAGRRARRGNCSPIVVLAVSTCSFSQFGNIRLANGGCGAKRPFKRRQHLVAARARVESELISLGSRLGKGA